MVLIRCILSAIAFWTFSVDGIPNPISKRIAQVISDSTTKWVAACQTAGGGQNCGTVSVAAFTTLLAAGNPCDHQDAADNMIDLAKTLPNNAQMISLTQVFVQQPRNAPDSLAVLYCQKSPRNAELHGLFQCQFAGVNEKVFTGNVAVGALGTIPLGLTAPLSPAGSCPANPSGPIADGTQLTDITTNPGINNAANRATASKSEKLNCPALNPAASPLPSSTPASSKGFKKQNGLEAQALNAKFATLTASSSCVTGQNACVNSSFAQCVGNHFDLTSCGNGLICAALPLVNSPGTSITCTTAADRDTRISAAISS
ncbi:hypothetical protein BS47DRAFT_1345312 [Hydnum rufescens UP504]|uniref:Carbohydrate-binding module family 19 domain-containing protein n=1 Tax=Hydnum rufescens UP504 TaxID=1448309 RepID=A0A9P6AVP7_9AGAM|nr:hypothetical protein BS47DRAFT_1345312 [Hydnum rufescens UP504]